MTNLLTYSQARRTIARLKAANLAAQGSALPASWDDEFFTLDDAIFAEVRDALPPVEAADDEDEPEFDRLFAGVLEVELAY